MSYDERKAHTDKAIQNQQFLSVFICVNLRIKI